MTTESNKVAIVTGAAGGIGAAVAERLARDGLTVVVNYAGNPASAEALVRQDRGGGGRAVAAQADISDAAAVARMFDSAETAFGGVDVLINNAGIMNLATIAESDDALFDRQIAVNLKGTFNTLREAAKRLRDGGRIVNFSSSVVGLLQPTYGVYAATKAAVEAMTSILAKELRGRNITVNAIAPGPTATKLFLDGKPQEVIDRLAKMAPLERLGQPEDIADASPSSRARTAPGSTARPCAPTAGSSDPDRQPLQFARHIKGNIVMSKQVILVTGASSGFGLMTARALAQAGHTVYASMRETEGRNAPQRRRSRRMGCRAEGSTCAPSSWTFSPTPRPRPASPRSSPTPAASMSSSTTPATWCSAPPRPSPRNSSSSNTTSTFWARNGSTARRFRICAVAARGCWSGSVRPRRAAARRRSWRPISPRRRRWTLWRSPTPPSWRAGGSRPPSWSPAPSPRAPTTSLTQASRPTRRASRNTKQAPMPGIAEKALKGLAALEPADADPAEVAREIVRVVDAPFGKRPFRAHVDPSQDGAEIVNGVADRMRREMYRNIGLEDLLSPRINA